MNEATIRLGFFATLLTVVALLETIYPRRPLQTSRRRRWLSNISISFISTVLIRTLSPMIPTAMALYCFEHGWGVFNWLKLPAWVEFICAILFLDMLIYWQHVFFHKIRPLWKIHRMHHADLDIDSSTGIRFHPLEILLSTLIKFLGILFFGPSPMAVLFFEILLNSCALFNHANIFIPLHIDKILRLLIVTPDQHRIHHSTDMREANKNFGFNFPWWDRLFQTYQSQPALGHTEMHIGMNIFRSPEYIQIRKMLSIPFL
ncbi:sterol desaturase family protein [Pseudodesulfovibrio piezophilus]|uniref:Sterol desaturase-related protein n=1 Tax=Pseudodesulfovibrio piezophilus (strain DSM 21447 / JCM 15486 / C1TLV30) TaxID=1322246 RepID=M1WQ19_PSEP2|nr:sterol desaturase family protein [Pseudodesulfovibrio piezophilus]CCH47402.1 Sterol desaturase-related protein [Pseudodesulfovibrio piezophilus C1TLV30]